MRMVTALFVSLLILIPVNTVAEGAASPAPESKPSESSGGTSGTTIIPTWRLSVRTYGQSYGYPVLGIYRRVGDRHDLGVAFSGGIASRTGDRIDDRVEYDYDVSHETWDWERDDYDLEIHAEMRRWWRISDRVSWYGGARLTTSYSHDDDENTGVRDTNDYAYGFLNIHEYEAFGLGTSLTMGADLELLHHLSVSASFMPLNVMHNWYKRTYDETDTRDDEESRFLRTEKDRGLSVRLYPYAAAYLSVTF